MTSKDKFIQKGNSQLVQQRSNDNTTTNNIKSYSIKNLTVEKSVKTSYINNNGQKYAQQGTNQINTSQYQKIKNNKNQIPKNISKEKNNTLNEIGDTKSYEYSSKIIKTSNAINLKHHPNQVNNLIHNHKYYTSNTSKSNRTINTVKSSKTSKTITSTKTDKSQRTQSLSPLIRKGYEVESRKVEIYSGKQRYSSASNSSGETNISISKSQIKQLMTNMWLEEMYCSDVESLCCLVDNKNKNKGEYIEAYEKELENNAMIIKEYEAEIIKLKSVLNIKEQEMKQLVHNLKQSENALKIKNKKIYELNIKTEKNKEEFDKDTHELQIISTKQETKKNMNLDKDSHSLQILSMKKGWNESNVPSPINEIYIETLKHEAPINKKKYEEMRRIIKRKEEEIIKLKLEKIPKLEIQEMGILSIISKKPPKNIMCQHLESIMILSKIKKGPLKFQKIEEIIITSHSIKVENEIQELDGLEIINIKKKKPLILQEQCLNGLEIRRDYDMLLVKPVWDSLQIQGAGLNLLAIKKEIELENQEIDEFLLPGLEKPQNIIKKVSNFRIIGKTKKKVEYKINKERIKLTGMPEKEEVNWNDIISPNKSAKLLIKRDYDKIEPKIEINWDDIIKPIKTTKLLVKGKKPKENVLKVVKKDKFNILYSSPVKNMDEYDIENFDINLISSEQKITKPFKMAKAGFNIKGKEKEKKILIKNRMDSISIFGLTKEINLIPSSTEKIFLRSDLEIELNKNWNDINKVMKARDLIITRKTKVKNIISKKVVNIEIKTFNKKIIKPIKEVKLIIKGTEKKEIEKPKLPILKPIKENKLSIRALKKVEKTTEIILKQKKENKLFIKGIKKEEKEIPNWNDLIKLKKVNSLKLLGKKIEKIDKNAFIKIDKKPSINIIHRPKKIVYKKQILNSFGFRGIEQVEKELTEKKEIINNWANILKAQRNAKFNIKAKTKTIKLIISKYDRFMIKREPEEEIIYNDDYNHLIQSKKENGKETKEKILVIKEREIKPILHREIRAQVVKVKEEASETSSQSDVDVLAGIKRQSTIAISSGKVVSSAGFSKKVLNGEVIFTPNNNLGVNLGAAKYKKQMLVKKGLKLYNQNDQGRLTGIEIVGNNGEVHYEKMSGIGGIIKEGNYKIMNGSANNGINNKKKLTTIYQSSSNLRRSNKLSKVPNDSKQKIVRKQIIIKSRLKSENKNDIVPSGNISTDRIMTSENYKDGSKTIIFNSKLSSANMKHSYSTYGISQEKGNVVSMKKEETYFYEHRDNGNIVNKNQTKKIETFKKLKEE